MITQAIILGLALQTALLVAIALYFGNWIWRFVAITSIVVLANSIYFTFESVKGWPSEDTRVVKGILSSVVIVNPSNGDEGAIYISLFPTTPSKWYEYQYNRKAPKTFYIKYTNDRAAKFEEAKQALSEGKEVRINGVPSENSAGQGSGTTSEDGIVGAVNDIIQEFMGSQKDTYRPNVQDIEINETIIPPKEPQ